MTEAPPLAGIKVIDLTRYLAGPFCTQILGDYGAEIIKVEPVEGARADLGKYSGKDNYFFLSSNRSKKSVQIDTEKSARARGSDAPAGRFADVLVDNFRPGVIEAMGFGYEALVDSATHASSPAASRASARPDRCATIRASIKSRRGCRA